MRKGKTIATIALGGAAVFVFLLSRDDGHRTCGHKHYPLAELSPFRATHCCLAGSLVSELGYLYGAEEMYRHDHGAYATSLSQLTNSYLLHVLNSPFQFHATSNDWSCVVPRSEHLPGSYLLSSDGKLYFSERGTPTTNSMLLRDSRTGFSRR